MTMHDWLQIRDTESQSLLKYFIFTYIKIPLIITLKMVHVKISVDNQKILKTTLNITLFVQ